MARPRKASQQKLSSGQASYIIDRLIGDRRISWNDVHRYTEEMKAEIDHLEERLKSLRAATGEAIRSAVHALKPGRRRGRPPGAGRKRGRRSAITAEQLASRQLQGRYLGLIRQIPASRRGQYQRIAKEKGREAAIKEMQSALHK